MPLLPPSDSKKEEEMEDKTREDVANPSHALKKLTNKVSESSETASGMKSLRCSMLMRAVMLVRKSKRWPGKESPAMPLAKRSRELPEKRVPVKTPLRKRWANLVRPLNRKKKRPTKEERMVLHKEDKTEEKAKEKVKAAVKTKEKVKAVVKAKRKAVENALALALDPKALALDPKVKSAQET